MGIITHQASKVYEKVLKTRGRIPRYIISENGIKREFKSPKEIEEMAYDLETYKDHQIFLKDYANPVEVSIEDANTKDYELIPSQRYKTYMKQKVLEQAFFSEGLKMNKILYLIIGSIAAQTIFALIIIMMVA